MANSHVPRKILLVKTSSLGDVVHNLPLATLLRANFPDAQLDWVVEEAFADIPRLHPAIGRVIPVALRRWRRRLHCAATWREMAAFRRQLRQTAYDLVLDSQGLIKSGLVVRQALLASGGQRAGYSAAAAREPLAAGCYDRRIGVPRQLHAVARNLRLGAAACDLSGEQAIDYGIAATPLAAPWLPVAPYALLFTASSRADKSWPRQSWLDLATALQANGMTLVLPAGSDAERLQAGELAAAMGSRATLAPKLTLAELAGLCAGAQLVVGVDTGLTHLGAALGRPTLCLFAGSDPALTGVLAQRASNLGRSGQPPTAAEANKMVAELLRQGAP